MARPRKTRSPEVIEAATAAVNKKALDDSRNALVQRSSELSVIDLRYAIDGEYDFNKIDAMLPSVMSMSVASALWVGRALILVREHEPHGSYLPFLQKHGIHQRTAQRYIGLAKRFGTSEQRKVMLGRLGVGNALELWGESEETIDAMASDEDHEVYSLSREEIRKRYDKKDKAIAKLEQKLEATDHLLADKNKKIDDLDRMLKGRDAESPLERATHLLTAIDVIVMEHAKLCNDLLSAIDKIYEIQSDPDQAIRARINQAADHVVETARGLETFCSA